MRIILFTGKGGVGKTTIAAATAHKAAQLGQKVLVISTDPAHSLSDALGQSLGPEPVKVAENLWGQELDVYYSMKKYWGNMRELIRTVFRWQGVDHVLAEEISAVPGMEEGSAFLWIEKYFEEKFYDLIVIDSAPTGETLTLLSLPQVAKWWMNKALPGQSFAIKAIGSVVRGTTGIPLDKGYEELQQLFVKLEKVQKLFTNPAYTSIRIVMNPENMVIKEAKRAYTYLQLYGYNVDAVVVNRILPEMEGASFFREYVESQKKYLQEIEESFAPLPILKVEHQGKEVFGEERLSHIANSVYGEQNPTQVFHQEAPLEVVETPDGYAIKIKLPFIAEKDFTLNKYGDELVIDLGNRRQNVFLPRFANFLSLKSHKYMSPWLYIELKKG